MMTSNNVFILCLLCILSTNMAYYYDSLPKYKISSMKSNYVHAVKVRSHIQLYQTKENDDVVSRRRRRSGRSKKIDVVEKNSQSVEGIESTKNTKIFAPSTESNVNIQSTAATIDSNAVANKPPEESVERLFGLGNDQLRELLEQELPVPKEDLVTKKEVKESNDKERTFNLPELSEYLRETKSDVKQTKEESAIQENKKRVSRKNEEEYLRVLQLNPFADADETLFLDEYDIIPSIFGSGKLLNIPVPYLQTGHGVLLLVSLLSGFVYYPGNPLTEFPIEIRDFLKTGLAVVYSINTVLAVQAYFVAKSKNLPGLFWAVKTFLLGGVAFYEIKEAKDPKFINDNVPRNLKDLKKSKK